MTWRGISWRGLFFAALAVATVSAHSALPADGRKDASGTFVPDPRVASLASLGFRNVVSDYYWLLALQIVGASQRDPSIHGPVLGRLVDVVTTLDPWVDHPYRFAALWMTDSPESVMKADELLDRGIAHHPDEWRNLFYQGFNRFFYLLDAEGAADSIERAAKLPGAPAYLERLVVRLRAGEHGLDASAAMMAELIRQTEDPFARAEYEKALDEIETERILRTLDAAREEYRRRNGRDIATVEDLARGPGAVLAALPPELHGWEWTLDPASGQIVSSWYRHRYEPLIHPAVRREREADREQREAARARAASGTSR